MFTAFQIAAVVASLASVQAATWGELPTVALDCTGECLPYNGKVTDGNLRPCCESSDVLVIKDGFQFAQCRRKDGQSSETWASGNIVICNGVGGGFDGEVAGVQAVSGDSAAAEQKTEDTSGDVVDNEDNATVAADGSKGDGDAVVNGSSGDGFCEASGLPSCALSTKCCASSRMPKTNCCEAGSKCIAKNKFYAACLPDFREERAKEDPSWLAIELKCGEDVELLPDVER